MLDNALVRSNLAALHARLAAAAGANTPPLVIAVTKGFGRDAVDAALAAGLTEIGESYAQETLAKLPAELDRPRVHFIGRLQRNKVRKLAAVVDVWQSVDRIELVREIAKHAPGAQVMIQVDISEEPSKGGCAPAQTPELCGEAAALGLDVVGLMGVAPLGAPDLARPGFQLLRHLVDDLSLDHCSMGMSADLEVAVQEGATMVRVGTDLFGPRPPR